MANQEDIVELLHGVTVFEALAPDDLQRVAQVAVPRRFAAGQVIFREGDESDTCYVVRRGHCRAIRENTDGRTIALAHFGPGDIFGELAMFDDERRSATIETLDDVEAIAIAGSDMRRLLREHADIAVKLVIGVAPPPARGERAPDPPVLPDRPEPRRGRARCSSSSRRRPRARGRATSLVPVTQAEIAAARRLLARVGQPLPRRPRAGRGHHPGPRPRDRPRPGSAQALRLLTARGGALGLRVLRRRRRRARRRAAS